MTIDSDGEFEQKVKGSKKNKTTIVSADEEQILLSNEVVIATDSNKVRTGSNQMWNFKDAVVLGKHAQSLFDGLGDATTATDEKAPFQLTIEERVK